MKLSTGLPFRKLSPVEISIQMSSQNHAGESYYSTGDRIEGSVSVCTKSDTEIEGVQIVLQGITRNNIELVSSLRQTCVKHIFLSMHQPMGEMRAPIPRVLKGGKCYNFAFDFVVPEYVLPKICSHPKHNVHVSHSHIRLPPSMGSSTYKMYPGSNDGLSSDVVNISYSIRASIFAPAQKDGHCHQLEPALRPIWIIPTAHENPPISHLNNRLYRLNNDCTLRYELWNLGSGKLYISAQQPKPFRISTKASMEVRSAESMATIELKFVSDTSQKPPKLHSIAASLLAMTFYSSKGLEDFPDLSFGTPDFGTEGKGVYQKAMPLSERRLKSIHWSRSTSRDYSNEYKAIIEIPIAVPRDRSLMPTFHSCLVSRIYILELSLSYYLPRVEALRSSLDLRVPIQVTNEK